jgi:hypothetical protein
MIPSKTQERIGKNIETYLSCRRLGNIPCGLQVLETFTVFNLNSTKDLYDVPLVDPGSPNIDLRDAYPKEVRMCTARSDQQSPKG